MWTTSSTCHFRSSHRLWSNEHVSRAFIDGLIWMYDIVINEFEATLRACPDELWEASMWDVGKDKGYWAPTPPLLDDGKPDPRGIQVHSQFWHVAYHTLYAHD